MKRAPAKKGIERRRRIRTKSSPSSRTSTEAKKEEELCKNCVKSLHPNDRALFVEEEVGRIFCSEACIAAYFSPDIKRLEKEYFRRLSPNDLSGDEREELAHLRWLTLQEPDEVWREKTLSGDLRFTLISEFRPHNKRIWYICICLFLRGEPSFLYLAFPTKNSSMSNYYRRGEQVRLDRSENHQSQKRLNEDSAKPLANSGGDQVISHRSLDGLASAWTRDETLRAQIVQGRNPKDIHPSEFGLYQSCFDETLEAPDEVWSMKVEGDSSLKLYHFIKEYSEANPGYWYVIVAREVEDEEQIEILDAFPSRDADFVDRYRRGEQEVGQAQEAKHGRVVH